MALPFRLVYPDISESAQARVLQLFPTESSPNLTNTVETLLRLTSGAARTSKELGTVRTHRLHYYKFCYDVKFTDDLLLKNVPQARRNWQLALYAAHLATGNTFLASRSRPSLFLGTSVTSPSF